VCLTYRIEQGEYVEPWERKPNSQLTRHVLIIIVTEEKATARAARPLYDSTHTLSLLDSPDTPRDGRTSALMWWAVGGGGENPVIKYCIYDQSKGCDRLFSRDTP
jgi:hypothetical protein